MSLLLNLILLLITTHSYATNDRLYRRAVDSCGRLCDNSEIDAIVGLSVGSDKSFFVQIVRGLCSWILDLNNKNDIYESVIGQRHEYKYATVEAMFSVFDNPENSDVFNLTALFTSGMSGQVFRYESGKKKSIWNGTDPLPGLNHKPDVVMDAAFGWQPDSNTKLVKLIQNDVYYTYDLKTMKQLSGPNDLTKDYGFDVKTMGRITAAFSDGKSKIGFFTQKDYYFWISGVLGPKHSIITEFYRCKDGGVGGVGDSTSNKVLISFKLLVALKIFIILQNID